MRVDLQEDRRKDQGEYIVGRRGARSEMHCMSET